MSNIQNLEIRPDGSKHYVVFSVDREKTMFVLGASETTRVLVTNSQN